MAPMDDAEAGRYWNRMRRPGRASAARATTFIATCLIRPPSWNCCRPCGLMGLDLGCGEGNNTGLIARRGARMIGIDVAPTFVRYAHDAGT